MNYIKESKGKKEKNLKYFLNKSNLQELNKFNYLLYFLVYLKLNTFKGENVLTYGNTLTMLLCKSKFKIQNWSSHLFKKQ